MVKVWKDAGEVTKTFDIDKNLYEEFEAVTSVPGGVGIMTVLEVIKNSIECYRRNK